MRANGKPETLDVLRAWVEHHDAIARARAAGLNMRAAADAAADLEPWARWPDFAKVVYRLTEQLAARGLVDYGVSPRLAWPTAKGREHLARVAREHPHRPQWVSVADSSGSATGSAINHRLCCSSCGMRLNPRRYPDVS